MKSSHSVQDMLGLYERKKKGQKEKIRAYAQSIGMSLQGYINKLIADDMGAALTVPTKQQGD